MLVLVALVHREKTHAYVPVAGSRGLARAGRGWWRYRGVGSTVSPGVRVDQSVDGCPPVADLTPPSWGVPDQEALRGKGGQRAERGHRGHLGVLTDCTGRAGNPHHPPAFGLRHDVADDRGLGLGQFINTVGDAVCPQEGARRRRRGSLLSCASRRRSGSRRRPPTPCPVR